MMLEGCKWDPQVGDMSTLLPFPLVVPARVVGTIGRLAEQLAAEALAAEQAILECAGSLAILGLPRALRVALRGPRGPTPAAARVIRFDFHPAKEGWRISEANADVPGGYTESSLFPRLMAEHFRGTRAAGDPAGAVVGALVKRMRDAATIGLVAATGYMEDQQVIAFLASNLAQMGYQTLRAHPSQISWDRTVAQLEFRPGKFQPLDAIVRFYQGEWLARWPRRQRWPLFFRGGETPVCNPGTALVIESKRFPLTWDRIGLDLPTWRALLPETIDPRRLRRHIGPEWVLKTAFCNTGDTVASVDVPDRVRWRRAVCGARLMPGHWVAQRRFEALSIPTPRGPMFPCLGVYTVDGKAAGLFGRLAYQPLIDFEAAEVAVLLEVEGST
jgi:glutathionylspermidine synthase